MTDNKNTILYQNKEYSIGTNRELYNPYNKPLTDIIYELAKELESWKLQATSLSYADTICALEIDLEHKTQECEVWKKANDEKNELLAKLGCPTTATAKRKAHCLQVQLDKLKVENEIWKNQVLILDGEDVTVQVTQEQFEEYNNLKAAKEQAEQKNLYG